MVRALPQRRQRVGDQVLEKVQDNTQDLTKTLGTCPFLMGRLVSVQLTGGTAKVVSHNLGTPAACFVIRMNYDAGGAVNAPVFAESFPQPASLDLTKQLSVVASATCTIDLWFYPRASKVLDARTGISR